jgi:hypothetical protein
MKNWLLKNGRLIANICIVIAFTGAGFLLGAVYQLNEDMKGLKQLEIHTKIVEYRMGNITLGRDTMNVVIDKYK